MTEYVRLNNVRPSEARARDVLLRQLSQGDAHKAQCVRRLPLFDVALDGSEALRREAT